jgi:dipeptidase
MNRKMIRLITAALVFTLVFTMSAGLAFGCTTIIVGKDNTVDGSVMIAHSEELGDSPQHLVVVPRQTHAAGDLYVSYSGAKIPQPEVTYAYIASTIFDKEYYPGDYTTGINEYQVSVANNMSWTRGVPEDTAWDVIDGGVFWTEFTQLTLERCKTAREGVELMGQLCETYHLSCDPGTMYAIADPNEGWFIEIARDGQWIAQRVPDKGFDMRSNNYRIGVVDLDSPDILHSPNLVQYAIGKGWYDPKSGDFSFADVYGEPSNQTDEYNNLRNRLVTQMLTDYGKVSVDELMAILRSAYEGTEYYKTDPSTGSPFHTDIRTISRTNTEVTSVAQLRSWLPAEVGGVIWWALATSKTSPYVPYYYGASSFPEAYTKGTDTEEDGSAYWAFNDLRNYVDKNYSRTIDTVTSTWAPIEAAEFTSQSALEAEALKLYNTEGAAVAAKYLNSYSNAQGEKVYEMANDLYASLQADAVKYFDDIGSHYWAISAINKLYEAQIVGGVSEKKFAPDSSITRADFIVMLVRALDLQADFSGNFSDVKEGSYYYNAVGIAKALGITSGKPDGSFGPKENITRQDMVVLMNQALESKKLTLTEPASDLSEFTDSATVSSYAKDAVAVMAANGIINGSNDKIDPKALSTRAQAAVVLNRLLTDIE